MKLTINEVTNWKWITISGYRGKVPNMSKVERDQWVHLSHKFYTDGVNIIELALYQALDRKIKYRASKEIV